MCRKYIHRYDSYTGKDDLLDNSNGLTPGVVLKLLEGVENKGHHVYCDNYYTSRYPLLILLELGFGACGTMRLDRWRMPQALSDAKLYKGEVFSCEVEKSMQALKWRDKRYITMLSTIHDMSMVIERYNTYMAGVDKADQLLSYYGFGHRTVKWWRRALFQFENAIVNAYILYRISTQPG